MKLARITLTYAVENMLVTAEVPTQLPRFEPSIGIQKTVGDDRWIPVEARETDVSTMDAMIAVLRANGLNDLEAYSVASHALSLHQLMKNSDG